MNSGIVRALDAIAVELNILNKTLAKRNQPEPTEVANNPAPIASTVSKLYLNLDMNAYGQVSRVEVVGRTLKSGVSAGYITSMCFQWDVSALNLSAEFVAVKLSNGWYSVAEVRGRLLQEADPDAVMTAIKKLITREYP